MLRRASLVLFIIGTDDTRFSVDPRVEHEQTAVGRAPQDGFASEKGGEIQARQQVRARSRGDTVRSALAIRVLIRLTV